VNDLTHTKVCLVNAPKGLDKTDLVWYAYSAVSPRIGRPGDAGARTFSTLQSRRVLRRSLRRISVALHRVVIRQAINAANAVYKWSNVYYCDVADVPAAAAFGQQLAQAHREVLDLNAFVYEIYASDIVPNTDNYTVQAVSGQQLGMFDQGTSEFLPSFCVVRVDIGTSIGRPSRKFLRAPWREAAVINGTDLTTAAQAAITAYWAQAFSTGSPLRDPDGETFVSFSIRSVTSRRLGREAGTSVPPEPVA